MAKTKKIQLGYILFLVIAIIFPFGQLVRIDYRGLTVLPLDIFVLASFLLVYPKLKKTEVVVSTFWLLAYLFLSYLFSLVIYFGENTKGLLYLLRLAVYLFFPFFVSNLVKEGKLSRDYIFNLLILVLAFVGLFGWVQYLVYPDLRFLYHLGWDDHYFRLVGSFLDPGFTSILLVFGFNLSVLKYLQSENKKLIVLPLFFIVTLAFTFSRAGYLAFIACIFTLMVLKKKIKLSLLFLLAFVIIVLFLPRPGGEGVKLTRIATIGSRFENYSETFETIKKNPLFGLGYNNMCEARELFLGDLETESHGCTGSDSSLMLVMATSGILGIILFGYLALSWWKNTTQGIYKDAILLSVAGLLIHSLFVQSLFYPWVMVVVGILLALY